MPELTTTELLKKASEGNKESQERLILENSGLVKSIAKRFFNRGYDSEDIIQLGMMGLFKAISNFDTSFGVKFSTYAVPVITGEIKRFLRDDGIIKISRQTKEIAKIIYDEISNYEKENGSSPSISVLSEKTGFGEEEIIFALNSCDCVKSLDEMICNENEASLIDKIPDKNCLSENEIVERMMLENALSLLKPKERQVITLRYFKGLTQTEVSKKIGVSQVQVSRIEKKVLERMKISCINMRE